MTPLKLLSLFLLVSLFSVNHVTSEEDLEECPEYCKCENFQRYGRHIECSRITQTQYFQDPVTSFTLKRDVNDPAEPLELTSKFFIELGTSFKHVDYMLITVDLAKIDVDAFQGLDSLLTLNISNNGLTYIHPDTFLNNKGLRNLALTRNPLTFDEYFLNSIDLSELDLSFCQIRNLTANAFAKVKELTYLNLESNLIDTIDPRTFEPLTSLEELNLSNNKLRVLSPDSFHKNEALDNLLLSYNPLASIENLQLPNIKKLHLQHCDFTELNSVSFSAYIKIKNLNLSGNSIEKLSPDTFSKLEYLAYLDISNNKLGPLDSRLFSRNQELETLSLRDNPTMSSWPEEGFQGDFKHLYNLDISNTGIKSLALGSLKNMSNLAALYLGRNALNGFEKGVLPLSIKFLSLENNDIASINDINFSNEHKVNRLFLQGNKIKYLQPSNFDSLPHIKQLDLSSCELESLWLEGKTGEQKIQSLNQLDLSSNKLQKIVPSDLNVFSNLDMLDIRDNPFACNEDLDTLINYIFNSTITPARSSNVGNIDRNQETFNWNDIRPKNCGSPPKSPEKANEKHQELIVSAPQIPDFKANVNKPTVFTDDLESILYNSDYEDIIKNDPESEYDTNNYETTRIPHHKTVLTPQIVEVSNTSPVVVAFLSALVMTLIITLILALLTTLCKQRLIGIDLRKRPHRRYKPLHENEQVNLPTTPIVKVRAQTTENGKNDINSKNDSYVYNVNNGTGFHI